MNEFNIRSFTREAQEEVKAQEDMFKDSDRVISSEFKRQQKSELVQHKVAEAIASIAETLNGGDQADVIAGMLQGMGRTHRYIQSEFWRGMLEFIKQTSKLENFDGRNEWTQDLCARMYQAGFYPETVNMEKSA